MEVSLQSLDNRILLSVQLWRNRRINWFWVALTYTGTGKAWLVIAALTNALDQSGIRFAPEQFRFLRAMLAALLAWGLSHALKRVIARPRPSPTIEGFKLFLPPPTCGSFPSGHTAASFGFFFALILAGHPWAAYVGAWALLVSFSRLYLGVHYLSDILGGVIVGAISAAAIWYLGLF
jgi:undecaprenyl-diphosphatase